MLCIPINIGPMSGNQIFSDSFIAFGVQCDVVFPGTDADEAKELLQNIKKNISQIELAVSRLEEVGEIRQVNRAAKGEWVEVSGDLLELLNFSKNFYEMSNGALDVTIAPLLRLWETRNDPSEKEIGATKLQCGLDQVSIDDEQKRLMFLAEGMELDFGVLEKAYILDILKQELIQTEGLSGIISFEEEAVLALGKHPGGDEWPVGIRNLEDPDDFNHVFELSNQSMVTAGTVYLNFDTGEMNERLIISPESGYPIDGRRTVSVKAASALMATFIAHIWLILPENDKTIIADQLENIEIFETEYISNEVKTKHTIIEGGYDYDE